MFRNVLVFATSTAVECPVIKVGFLVLLPLSSECLDAPVPVEDLCLLCGQGVMHLLPDPVPGSSALSCMAHGFSETIGKVTPRL